MIRFGQELAATLDEMTLGDDNTLQTPSGADYVDWHKVYPIHFEGEFLQAPRPAEYRAVAKVRPTWVQAGGSLRGRAFAARRADLIMRRPTRPPA